VIGSLLKKRCEKSRLYLQHDLTLQQLAEVLGTNRTYLGQYFVQQGITYNSYINGLRVEHFMRLYMHAVASNRNVSSLKLSLEAGYRSYSTFSAAFKQYKGLTVTEWIKEVS
jgi:YesN/AraC family two-component response regulator